MSEGYEKYFKLKTSQDSCRGKFCFFELEFGVIHADVLGNGARVDLGQRRGGK